MAASNSRWFAGENGGYLAMILAGFLLYVAVYNTVRIFGGSSSKASFDETGRLPHWKVIAVGVPMGLMAGLLGIGGGALCVPLQQIVLRIPLRRAIANSAATIVSVAALGALYKNLTLPQHGVEISASLRLAATLIPTAILGSYLGSRLTHVLPRRILRIVFVVFMAAVAGVTFNRAYKAMAGGSKSSRLDKPAVAARDLDDSAPRNAQRPLAR